MPVTLRIDVSYQPGGEGGLPFTEIDAKKRESKKTDPNKQHQLHTAGAYSSKSLLECIKLSLTSAAVVSSEAAGASPSVAADFAARATAAWRPEVAKTNVREK